MTESPVLRPGLAAISLSRLRAQSCDQVLLILKTESPSGKEETRHLPMMCKTDDGNAMLSVINVMDVKLTT